MKKIYLIPALALLLGACSNDTNLTPSVDTPTHLEGKVTGYVNVQIVMPGSINSRADVVDGYEGSYTGDKGGNYLDGTASENNVNMVRFYFFDENDKSVKVRKNPNSNTSNVGNIDYYTFIDWVPALSETPTYPDNDNGLHNETVEKQYETTLILSQPDGDDVPEPVKIVAVVNPTDDILSLMELDKATNKGTSDLETLSIQIANYQTNLTDKNFVMSNSVYIEGKESNAAIINYSSIEEITNGNGGTTQTQTDATTTPKTASVTIYVERVVARVDFAISIDDEDKLPIEFKEGDKTTYLYKVDRKFTNTPVNGLEADKNGDNGKYDDVDIYLNVQGWALASYPSESYLVKHIDKGWATDLFKGTNNPWNTADYHRSFWGINPKDMTYNFYKFTEITTSPYVEAATGYNSLYTQENANPHDGKTAAKPEAPTQVIFVGQLGTYNEKDGFTPTTICEYQGNQYTEKGVKTLIVNSLDMYKKKANASEESQKDSDYEKVKADDLIFITQEQWLELGATALDPNADPEEGVVDDPSSSADPDQTRAETTSTGREYNQQKITKQQIDDLIPGRYYSFLVPKDYKSDTKTEWYYKTPDGKYEKIENVPQFIYQSQNFARIKVWNEGRTYFYHDIKHLGKKATGATEGSIAENGVVRNHIYDVKFNSILGLGTPVFDPNETIYPEKPQKEPDNLKATIKILSWRLVSDSYEVSW